MTKLSDLFQEADWKTEKHVPKIEIASTTETGSEYIIEVTVTVGKAISHPNTIQHHIAWISVYFLPEGEKQPVQIAHVNLVTNKQLTISPNISTIYTKPEITTRFKTNKIGVLMAASMCNIHGLWQSSKEIDLF